MTSPWRWAGACSIGTSHIKANIECQDRAACLTFKNGFADGIIAVVSDGAGSAQEAGRGATIVCSEFHRAASAFFRGGGLIAGIDGELVAGWVDAIRERINFSANAANLRPRDYAATLVALIVCAEHAVIIHIGDGAAVVRDRATQEWSVPSWPFHGEYASTTRFVTDDPEAQIEIVHVNSAIDRFAVFSDGIENLVLDHRAKTAPGVFFERLLNPVAACENAGRSRALSMHLRAYLGSEKVCAATDDDKSLILGALP